VRKAVRRCADRRDADAIRTHPHVVERFVAAMAGAAGFARQDRDEAAEVTARWIQGLDPEVAKQARRHMAFDPRSGKKTLEARDINVRVLMEQQKLRAPISACQVMDTRIIEKVMRGQPQFFSDLKPVP
jgi:ABC-type nitrate/sulfonate/bicarbonate transport system substrate-binding protein